MWNRISVAAVASFFVGHGVSGVLAYFGDTFAALILSIISTFLGVGLGIWWLISSRRRTEPQITTESIRRDINRQIRQRLWLQFIAFIVIVALITTGIQIYISRQSTQSAFGPQRPILAVDTEITDSNIFDGQDEGDIHIIFHFINASDNPSYQNYFRFICAPVTQPSNVVKVPDKYQANPIIKGALNQIEADIHVKPLVKIDSLVTIITRISLKYSNVPEDGSWYYETWWWALTADFSTRSINMVAVAPETREIFEPYFNSAYPDEWGKGE